MSLYDVDSLSNTPSLSTAVLNAVISLSNLSGLIAIFLGSCSNIILQCPNIALCSELKLTGTILISLLQLSPNFSALYHNLLILLFFQQYVRLLNEIRN